MGNKEKVKLVRGEDFDLVDQELAEAMSLIDAANERVAQLLVEEREGPAMTDDDALFGEIPAKPDATEVPPVPAEDPKGTD